MLYKEFSENFGIVLVTVLVVIIFSTVWITKVNMDRKNFKKFMEEIRKDIKENI